MFSAVSLYQSVPSFQRCVSRPLMYRKKPTCVTSVLKQASSSSASSRRNGYLPYVRIRGLWLEFVLGAVGTQPTKESRGDSLLPNQLFIVTDG